MRYKALLLPLIPRGLPDRVIDRLTQKLLAPDAKPPAAT